MFFKNQGQTRFDNKFKDSSWRSRTSGNLRRYWPTVDMSLLSTPSTAANLHQHAWLLDRQHMHTALRRWLEGQRCKSWRAWATDPCGDAVVEASQSPFAISAGKGKAAIANHLHDHADNLSIRQQSRQLGGEAAVPYSVVGYCDADKHSSGLLFSWKTILDILCQQGDLVCGGPLVSKARGSSGLMIGSTRP